MSWSARQKDHCPTWAQLVIKAIGKTRSLKCSEATQHSEKQTTISQSEKLVMQLKYSLKT